MRNRVHLFMPLAAWAGMASPADLVIGQHDVHWLAWVLGVATVRGIQMGKEGTHAVVNNK